MSIRASIPVRLTESSSSCIGGIFLERHIYAYVGGNYLIHSCIGDVLDEKIVVLRCLLKLNLRFVIISLLPLHNFCGIAI